MDNKAQMDIKVQRIYKMEGDGPLKAFVDININDAILIKGIKILNGKKGLFISMPSEQARDNKWYETIRCLNKDIREEVQNECLSAYLAEGAIDS